MDRVALCNYIRSLKPESDSNIKFLSLLRSRLIEEEIPPEYASLITGVVCFDFSNVPEEDDTLSDIATEYASYCKLVYDTLERYGVHSVREFHAYARFFNRINLQVEF